MSKEGIMALMEEQQETQTIIIQENINSLMIMNGIGIKLHQGKKQKTKQKKLLMV